MDVSILIEAVFRAKWQTKLLLEIKIQDLISSKSNQKGISQLIAAWADLMNECQLVIRSIFS